MGAVGAVLAWVGVAASAYSTYQYLFGNKNKGGGMNYKYTNSMLATKVDSTANVPIIYGDVKSAGNLVYSRLGDGDKVMYKVISLCVGRVNGISDIRFNDLPYSHFGGTGARYYLGTGANQILDSMIPGDTQSDKARLVGGLKHEAYLAVWGTAGEELGSGDFAVTCVVQGRIVKQYARSQLDSSYSYDSSIGFWYKEAYTNNAAWVVLDFMLLDNGMSIPINEINIDSFIEEAEYCWNPPLLSGAPHRFTINVIIDQSQSALECLKDLMACCRAYPTYQKGKIGIKIEKAENVSQVFKPKEINDLNVWWSSLDEIADIARIKYVEPDEDWAQISASADADTYLRPNTPLIKEIDLPGVTSFDQASRLAWFYLNQSTTCTMYVQFTTDRRAINRWIGDVIELQDEYITSLKENGRSGKRFVISEISEDDDKKITIKGREYNEYIYTDILGSSPPVINVIDNINPYSTPPDITGIDPFDQVFYVQKDKTAVSYFYGKCIIPSYPYYYQLRILYRQKTAEGEIGDWVEIGTSLSGQFTQYGAVIGSYYQVKVYLESTYSLRSPGYESDWLLITGKNDPPSKPMNLRATETTGGFNLEWDAVTDNDLAGYNIYEGNQANEDYLVSAGYAGTAYTYITSRTGSFVFHVRAVDTMGNMSEPATVVATIVPPEPVADFDVYQNGQDLTFRWTQNENERVKVAYEIRKGESWDLGEVMGRVTGSTLKVSYYSTKYTHKFWIKAISYFGVYSDDASYATIDIAPQANRNYIAQINPIQPQPEGSWDGSRINLSVVDGGLRLASGQKGGEQIEHVKLSQIYSCRNWIDASIIGVAGNSITWEEATFAWGDEKANSAWLPSGQTTNAYITHQISRKVDVPDDIIEAFPLHEDTTGIVNGIVPVVETGVTYDNGRFFKGAHINEFSYLEWNVNVPSIFSHIFHLRLTKGIPDTCTFIKLTGATGALVIGYYTDVNKFFLRDQAGREQLIENSFDDGDYLVVGLYQGESLRRFFIGSFSNMMGDKTKFKYSEENYPPVGTFTKFSLYGII